VADAEAEAENAADVLDEAESVQAETTGSEPLSAAEAAVESVPDADEAQEAEASERSNGMEQEQAVPEDGA
jgi:hypothetical protein